MEEFKLNKPLNHIAFIMDGNGRWAKCRGLKRTDGHKEGCLRIKEIANECARLKIKSMTIYAFSTENWNRPDDEIKFLFNYINEFFNDYIDDCVKNNIKINVFGDYSKLPAKSVNIINKSIELTRDNNAFNFNICLNYGSRQELVKAIKEIASDVKDTKIKVDDIDDKLIEEHLYTKNQPSIDLLIRTSGEVRLSNFMLYQLAYSEFIFTKTYWPDFNVEKLHECIREYEARDRRFGRIEEKDE